MKKFICVVMSMVLVVCLTACGSSKQVDANALATALHDKVEYTSELKEVKVEYYIDLPENATAIGYMSNGTTADEMIVVSCKSDSDAKTVAAQLEELLADQLDQAKKYMPEEAERIENAGVKQAGTVVILCIGSDADAIDSIIKEYVG